MKNEITECRRKMMGSDALWNCTNKTRWCHWIDWNDGSGNNNNEKNISRIVSRRRQHIGKETGYISVIHFYRFPFGRAKIVQCECSRHAHIRSCIHFHTFSHTHKSTFAFHLRLVLFLSHDKKLHKANVKHGALFTAPSTIIVFVQPPEWGVEFQFQMARHIKRYTLFILRMANKWIRCMRG